MGCRHACVTVGIVALCLLPNRPAAAQGLRYYHVDDLGSLGGHYLVALAINASGDVAGYGDLPDGTYHAFRWTRAAGLQDLGANGGSFSQAYAINDNGDVAGVYLDAAQEAHGFIAPRNGPMRDLSSPAQRICCVNSITNDRRIAGMLLTSDPAGQGHAFRTLAGGTLQDLGGQFTSEAWHINNTGDVTGFEVRDASGSTQTAFRFSDGIGKVDLGTLGGARSSGMSMNNAGVVVGWSEAPIEPGYYWSARAFRARPAFPMEDLGTLAGGHVAGAESINDGGAIVGWSDNVSGATSAFVYTDGGGMVDLKSRMPTAVSPTLADALAVNDSGQIAVLYNVDEGIGSFLLTPIADTHPPMISATVTPAVLTPPNLRMVAVNVAVTATDDYDPTPACAIARIVNDQAWSPSSDLDVRIDGPLTASLRAFRFPWGDGRHYTITVRCTDVSGNSGTADVVVTVPRTRPRDNVSGGPR